MIGNVFTLKQLEALVWVADLGSFRKAAHHLNTTQPNISSRISGLEKTLGLRVMQRDAGSIHLTEKGREIVNAARLVLRDAERIVEISERPDLVTDRIRLGVTELVACTWLHAYLRKLKARYPELNVELTVDLSRNLDVELSASRLDLAIQTAPFKSEATGTIALGDFDYIWVAAPQIAKALPGAQCVADLLPHSILTHARHTQAYTELMAYTQSASISTTQVVSSSSLASCVQMAADGMGVSLLPRALVQPQIDVETLRVVDVDWTPSPLSFAARFQSEKSARFVAHAAGLAADTVAEHKGT